MINIDSIKNILEIQGLLDKKNEKSNQISLEIFTDYIFSKTNKSKDEIKNKLQYNINMALSGDTICKIMSIDFINNTFEIDLIENKKIKHYVFICQDNQFLPTLKDDSPSLKIISDILNGYITLLNEYPICLFNKEFVKSSDNPNVFAVININYNTTFKIFINDKLYAIITKNENGYIVHTDYPDLIEFLNANKLNFFTTTYININDCPEWMQKDLYNIKDNRLNIKLMDTTHIINTDDKDLQKKLTL